jgi:AraC family transcriptional regulator, positive regulator of tynA and feaB
MSRMVERPPLATDGLDSDAPLAAQSEQAWDSPDGDAMDSRGGGPNHVGATQFRQMLERAYPYVMFDFPGVSGGDLAIRRFGSHQVAHVRSMAWNAETMIDKAHALGLNGMIKLVWQLKGSMTYESAERKISVNAGEIFLARSLSNYALDGSDDYEGVVMTFHVGAHAAWLDLVDGGTNEFVLGANSASVASAAGVLALMRQGATDSTSELALHSLFELATAPINRGVRDPSPDRIAPSLFRAQWLVRQNIADPAYGPERLAEDLGLSRRSLYNRFADAGMTPASFIRMVRVAQAKREIQRDPQGTTPLTAVAFRNGFPDSSSLSHAIKAAYGVTPKELRTTLARPNWRR